MKIHYFLKVTRENLLLEKVVDKHGTNCFCSLKGVNQYNM